ncbi:hypothetical protein GCM10023216_03610 [Isoptericola chiayiensis]|uniref:Uncharacterized protein n=1 Tax=Isoptericola chiayiensis TaxID=579446 RepID=A0ABP8Y252_9MICO|nr:hypothetical protein [Isoptericola chiayiensis]NOW01178.1 hypothetical protein [Isoptericola chiayiensis]
MHPLEAHAVARAVHQERLADAESARRARRQRESAAAVPSVSRSRRRVRRTLRRMFADGPLVGRPA